MTDELYHHGIIGQKWGVRRYQNPDGSLTPAGRERYGVGSSVTRRVVIKKKTGEPLSNIEELYDKSKKGTLASAAILATGILSGAATVTIASLTGSIYLYPAAAAVSATLAGSKMLIKSLQAQARTEKALNAKEGAEIDKKTGLPKKKQDYTKKQDLKMVNPLFKSAYDQTYNNCMMCTTTYDLRRRGYEVNAKMADRGFTHDVVKKWYPDAVRSDPVKREGLKDSQYLSKLKDTILSQGEGARGNLIVGWQNSFGGHSMSYEVSDGKVKILDGQTNKIYDTDWQIKSLMSHTRDFSTYRLDNVEPDWQAIKECCE